MALPTAYPHSTRSYPPSRPLSTSSSSCSDAHAPLALTFPPPLPSPLLNPLVIPSHLGCQPVRSQSANHPNGGLYPHSHFSRRIPAQGRQVSYPDCSRPSFARSRSPLTNSLSATARAPTPPKWVLMAASTARGCMTHIRPRRVLCRKRSSGKLLL